MCARARTHIQNLEKLISINTVNKIKREYVIEFTDITKLDILHSQQFRFKKDKHFCKSPFDKNYIHFHITFRTKTVFIS